MMSRSISLPDEFCQKVEGARDFYLVESISLRGDDRRKDTRPEFFLMVKALLEVALIEPPLVISNAPSMRSRGAVVKGTP